jgi:hypothetical protein
MTFLALEEYPPLIEIQVTHAWSTELRSPSAGVIERAENAKIAIAIPTLSLHAGEDRIDFVFVQAVERPAGRAFEGNQENLSAEVLTARLNESHHLEKRLHRCQARVACGGRVAELLLQVSQEVEQQGHRKLIQAGIR